MKAIRILMLRLKIYLVKNKIEDLEVLHTLGAIGFTEYSLELGQLRSRINYLREKLKEETNG